MIGARSTSAASSMLSARNAQTVGTLPAPSRGAEFSITELQWQYGRLKVPQFALGGEDNTNILTVQAGLTFIDARD